MNLLSLSKGIKAFGTTILFENVSFNIEDRDKVGFIGINGAGKTTLFKILTEQISMDDGIMFKNKETKIGYLEQHAELLSDRTVWDEVMTVFSRAMEIEKRLEEISFDIEFENGKIENLVEEQHRLSEEFERLNGFTYKSVARSSLLGLGFTETEFEMPFRNLSGGQKTRVLLCKILLGGSNLLLLDEPTNHLDMNAVEWLEGFLREYKGAVIVISHDRYFLDKVTNRTFELEHGKLTVYEGNYTTCMKLKEERRITEERRYKNTQREIKHLESIIVQQKQWNREKNIKTAESKQKVIDKLEQTLEKPQSEIQGMKFRFNTVSSGGNDVLICRNAAMEFGSKKLFDGVDLHIQKGDKTFLLGPNGCGKTTLFRILLGQLKPVSGNVKLGANIKLAYYDQEQNNLSENKTVFDEIYDCYPKMTQTEIRNALAIFLFKGEEVFKPVSALSGGERARVLLLKLMLSDANFLLLDEPTNHLDIQSREALEEALSGYEGTLFAISHDRYFINKLATKICRMMPHGLELFSGNYEYYAEKMQQESNNEKESIRMADSQKETGNLYKQRKAEEAAKRKRENQIKKTEAEIAQAEAKQAELNEKLSMPEYATNHVKAAELFDEIEQLGKQLENLYEAWEQLGE